MSEDANGKDNGKTVDGKSVCRDFLNNICNRGSRCKFFHPEVEKPAMANGEDPYNFCIDFQNQGCYRENCRFIHAHQDDVERYKKTGDVTLSLARSIAAMTRSDTINGIPICKEFQMGGGCSRGPAGCRHWHINVDEEKERRRALSIATIRGAGRGGRSADRYGRVPLRLVEAVCDAGQIPMNLTTTWAGQPSDLPMGCHQLSQPLQAGM
uniref:C3H1-type domain-containing protein n=1 Tax=Ditylenchus dipsaci TaxID=166011 RepID=A0A915ER38_9BILA